MWKDQFKQSDGYRRRGKYQFKQSEQKMKRNYSHIIFATG